MSEDARFHVRFMDEAAGEELGLLLVETPQVGISRRLINPYAAKGSTGATKDSDLTEWSVVSQRDWRGGRGQEDMEEASAFLDAWNLETRIKEQLTLGPLPQNPVGTLPKFEPGNTTWYEVEYPGPERNLTGGSDSAIIYSSNNTMGQRFRVGHTVDALWIKSVKIRVKKQGGASSAIRLAIHAVATGGEPAASALAYKEVAAASVGASYGWVEFTLDTPLQMSTGYYWIVVSSTDASGYVWEMGASNPYPIHGFAAWKRSDGSWSLTVLASYDFTFKVHWSPISRSMSFLTPVGGVSCAFVQLYTTTNRADWTVVVRLCEDNAGVPGTVLKSKTVTVTYGWTIAEWDSAQALAAGNTYHIVMEPTTEGADAPTLNRYMAWGGNSGGGYGDGGSNRKAGTGSWTAQTEDLYFRVNRDELDGDIIAFARYKDKWYGAGGDTIYEWDNANLTWNVSDAQAGDNVTAMEVWGAYLWAARGADLVLRRYNGTAWSDVAGKNAQHLKAGGGYLHYSGGSVGDTHKVYYTANGTDWSAAIEIGAGDHAITGMAWYRDMMVLATAVRLWGIAAEMAYPLLDWSSQEDTDNGRAMLTWGRTGCLYIPLRFGLYRWNGDTMVAVGPEQGTGLPADRAGKISALVGTGNWLFAAVDAGASGRSSVLAYNGMGGWHELQRCEQDGQRIKALGFETLHSPNRLWFGMSKETRYLMLPDYTDNPWQWSGYEFNVSGEVELSWMGGELLDVVKDLREVVIRSEGVGAGQPVDVYYEIDRSGVWTWLGTVENSPREVLEFASSQFPSKTIGSGSTVVTIEVAADETTDDMAAADWCRINGEVSQVASITDSDTFVLETALSEAPDAGDVVYATLPAGREFRLRLVLKTNDKTATPKVKAAFLRYQNNVLDRFVYSLQVRVEDGMTDLAGNPYPHTAADLRVVLDEWAKRVLPFALYDQDGVEHTVKVTSVGEGGMTRRAAAGQAARYLSVYSMNLVEVG